MGLNKNASRPLPKMLAAGCLAVLALSAGVVALPILTFPGAAVALNPAMDQPDTAAIVASPQSIVNTSLKPLFPDVPPGGYPHSTYTEGNCTWWVAYNRLVPPYLGDAWQWLGNAAAKGMAISNQPTVHSIVVYKASPAYDPVHGHVAVVIALGSGFFRLSEMNFTGLGLVDERDSLWPDSHVEGFIT